VVDLIDIAVMEPKYQINLGYIARVLKNFGIERLYLINPRCDYKGRMAVKYSKHAHALLERAKVLGSIDELAKNAFVIGTTGIWSKTDSSFRNVCALQSAGSSLRRISASHKRVVLLIGRDDTGLSREELRKCDETVFIGASRSYPVLNISHALAIMLYELTLKDYGKEYKFLEGFYADEKQKRMVMTLFERMIARNSSIRDKGSVAMAFRHLLNRGMPTKKEINAIAIALSEKE
jgi:TrmH family RNA methyltransferase